MKDRICCFLGEYLSTKINISYIAKRVQYVKIYCTFYSQKKIGDAVYELL